MELFKAVVLLLFGALLVAAPIMSVCFVFGPGPKVIKLFLCSAQLS